MFSFELFELVYKILSISHKTDLNIFTEVLKEYWPLTSVTSIKSMYTSSTLFSLPEVSDSINFINCAEFFSFKSCNSFEGVTLNTFLRNKENSKYPCPTAS